MTLYSIPCVPNGRARWDQRTQLDGRDFMLSFSWNSRDGHWSLSIADQDSVPIVSGIRLVTNFQLLRSVDPRRPPGELVVVDTDAEPVDPDYGSLGTKQQLIYVSVG